MPRAEGRWQADFQCIGRIMMKAIAGGQGRNTPSQLEAQARLATSAMLLRVCLQAARSLSLQWRWQPKSEPTSEESTEIRTDVRRVAES